MIDPIFFICHGTRALNLILSASNDLMLIVLMARSTTCVDGLGLQSTSSPWARCKFSKLSKRNQRKKYTKSFLNYQKEIKEKIIQKVF